MFTTLSLTDNQHEVSISARGPMPMKAAVLVLSATLATLGAACFLVESDRIGEEQAARYAEANRELAASLPVAPEARLLEEKQFDCSGAYRHEAADACVLKLTYETPNPLGDVLGFYDGYFLSEGWTSSRLDSEVNESYRNEQFLVQTDVTLGIPHGVCPDAAFDPEGNRRCLRELVERSDGQPRKYNLHISPK